MSSNDFQFQGAFPKMPGEGQGSSDIFAKPNLRGGGGGAAAERKAEEDAQSQLEKEAEDYYKQQDKVKDPPPSAKPETRLTDPIWEGEQGYFNEKSTASVKCELPSNLAHITKVTFTAYALLDGKLERVDTQDGHITNGIATAEPTLWPTHSTNTKGNSTEKCQYVFKAQHRYSKEVESKPLPVSKKDFCLEHLADVLATLEKEQGPASARFFAASLDYRAICDLAKTGTPGNNPNNFPTGYFLIPGADDTNLKHPLIYVTQRIPRVSLKTLWPFRFSWNFSIIARTSPSGIPGRCA